MEVFKLKKKPVVYGEINPIPDFIKVTSGTLNLPTNSDKIIDFF